MNRIMSRRPAPSANRGQFRAGASARRSSWHSPGADPAETTGPARPATASLAHLAAQIGRARSNAGSNTSTSDRPSREMNAVACFRSGPMRTSVTVIWALARSGSRNSPRPKIPASTWRISSATRSCRWVGPALADGFLNPGPSPSRSTRRRRLPAGRGSWRTTGRIHSRAPLRARRP